MKLPKKPTKKKYPKKPKASAPVSSWEKYDHAKKAVDKHNAEKLREHTKKVAAIKAAHKKKEALIKKHKS